MGWKILDENLVFIVKWNNYLLELYSWEPIENLQKTLCMIKVSDWEKEGVEEGRGREEEEKKKEEERERGGKGWREEEGGRKRKEEEKRKRREDNKVRRKREEEGGRRTEEEKEGGRRRWGERRENELKEGKFEELIEGGRGKD